MGKVSVLPDAPSIPVSVFTLNYGSFQWCLKQTTMAHPLRGTAFITGAGSGRTAAPHESTSEAEVKTGIGAGVALKFIQDGVFKLALVDINSSNLQNVCGSLKQTSPYVELLTASVGVTNEEQVNNAVQEAATKFGRVDIGVNCAGVGDPGKPTDRLSLRDWQRTIDINQTGVWLSQRALVRQMLTQRYQMMIAV